MTTITHTATGRVATAQNDQFAWFYAQPDYVTEAATGRSIYLPVGGYSKPTGLGCDPAPADVIAAARAFVASIDQMQRDADDAAALQADADMAAATAVLASIPAGASAELAAINAGMARRATAANEGGDGYVPQIGWGSAMGREIAARHGLDADAIVAALAALSR